MAIFVPRFLRQLRDVVISSVADEDVLTYDSGTGKWINAAGGGGGGVTDHGALTGLADDDHLQYHTDARGDARYQPLDSDLTAIAALSTTSFGRGLLALANQAALLSTAGGAAASHAHAGEDITSGTVADARIASTIARDSEVAAGYQPLDSDLTAIAALTTTTFGRSVLALADQAALLAAAGAAAASHAHAGEDITSGTVADARIASTIARDAEVTAAIAAALAAADGAGLSDNGSGVLAVNVDDSTIEIATDALRVKASGITANEIATNAVGSSELADDAVDTNAIQAGAVTAAKVAADVATQAELDAHVNDTSAAHAASAVSADSTTLVGTGTDVQAVLEELDNGIADHLADTSDAHDASAISVLDTNGDYTATDVEGVLAEIADMIAAGGGDDPVADILGPPDTAFEFDSSSLAGLTAVGSPDAEDADTSIPGHYYIRDDDGAWVGRYCAAPSAPWTAVTKISDRMARNEDGFKAGLFAADASPAMSGDADVWLIGNSGNNIWLELASNTNVSSNNLSNITGPIYLAIRFNSPTDIDYLFSYNGRIWRKIVDSRDPSITFSTIGLIISSNGAIMAAAFDYLRIWNSAKAFPGALP